MKDVGGAMELWLGEVSVKRRKEISANDNSGTREGSCYLSILFFVKLFSHETKFFLRRTNNKLYNEIINYTKLFLLSIIYIQ